MKAFVASTLLVLFATTAASAQQTATDQAAQIYRGNIKIAIGAGLLGAAAITLPVTAAQSDWSGPTKKTGVGLIAVGGGVLLWGLRERQQALRPQTTFGLAWMSTDPN